ncbi:metallo beta-lactamase family protein [Salmonella phage 41]|nr:metallo beta-lactamase family protein [Salmonella phage 41]
MFKLKLVHKSDNGEYIEHESHHATYDEAVEEADDIAFSTTGFGIEAWKYVASFGEKADYTISTPLTVIPRSSTLSESSGQYDKAYCGGDKGKLGVPLNRKQRRAEAAITRSKRKGAKR